MIEWILVSASVLSTVLFFWLYRRERSRRRRVYAPHATVPVPPPETTCTCGVLRFYFKNARYAGFALADSEYQAFVAGWNSAAAWRSQRDGHEREVPHRGVAGP